MKVRARRSKSKTIPKLLIGLQSIARGEVIGDTAAEIVPRMTRAMHKSLRPHRRTGAAERVAIANANRSTITLENVGYGKFIKDYIFGKRLPNNWVNAIKAALNKNARKALRGIA